MSDARFAAEETNKLLDASVAAGETNKLLDASVAAGATDCRRNRQRKLTCRADSTVRAATNKNLHSLRGFCNKT